MDSRVVLTDEELIARCRDPMKYWVRRFGSVKVPEAMLHPHCAASRAVSSHGAEANPELWAKSKMGEAAFAIWCGVGVERLKWNPDRPDNGYDVTLSGYRIDVKTIDLAKRYLCWPINKNSFYLEKRFYGLVLVKGNAPEFWVNGWIDKAGFYSLHGVSDGSEGLTPGTWNMHEDRLWPLQHLCDITGCGRQEAAQ